jgi:hypothetical protein
MYGYGRQELVILAVIDEYRCSLKMLVPWDVHCSQPPHRQEIRGVTKFGGRDEHSRCPPPSLLLSLALVLSSFQRDSGNAGYQVRQSIAVHLQ